ncbi:hypothetical protein K5X82_03435 [Halosquirtibacter xylanolyticus]|uniref:hypothetical protein n=1 Tax=Halosquirtibacter xylanolyticus TaxID=3374599 RepID=UPI0037482434|nr:hypothetical protein K5X82_03435 [Prolixibacteraceae bacterium]
MNFSRKTIFYFSLLWIALVIGHGELSAQEIPKKLGDYVMYVSHTKGIQVSLDVDALNRFTLSHDPDGKTVDEILYSAISGTSICVDKMSNVYVFYPCPVKKSKPEKQVVLQKVKPIKSVISNKEVAWQLKKSQFVALNRMNTLGFQTREGEWLWNSSNAFLATVSDSLCFSYNDLSDSLHLQKIVNDTVPHLIWAYLLDNSRDNHRQKEISRSLNGVNENHFDPIDSDVWTSPLQNGEKLLFDKKSIGGGQGPYVTLRNDVLYDTESWILRSNVRGFQVGNIDSWFQWSSKKDSIDQLYLVASLHRMPSSSHSTKDEKGIVLLRAGDEYLGSLAARYEHLVDNKMLYVDFKGSLANNSLSQKNEALDQNIELCRRRWFVDFMVGYQFYFNKNHSLDISLQEKYFNDNHLQDKNDFLPEYQLQNGLSSTNVSVSVNYPVRKRHMFSVGIDNEFLAPKSTGIDYLREANSALISSVYFNDQFRVSTKLMLRGDIGWKYFNNIYKSSLYYNLYMQIDLKEESFLGIRATRRVSSAYTTRLFYSSTGMFETSMVYQEGDPLQTTNSYFVGLNRLDMGYLYLDMSAGMDLNNNVSYLGQSSFYTDEVVSSAMLRLYKSISDVQFGVNYGLKSYKTKETHKDFAYLDGVSHVLGADVSVEDKRWYLGANAMLYIGDPWELPYMQSNAYQDYWVNFDFNIHYKCKVMGYDSKIKGFVNYQGNRSNLKSMNVVFNIGDSNSDIGLVQPSYYVGAAVEIVLSN